MPSYDPNATTPGDLAAAVQMLAASNARLCDIAIAADKLAEQLRKYIAACTTPSRTVPQDYSLLPVRDLLDAYTVVRNGQ